MPRPRRRVEVRRKIRSNAGCLALLALIIVTITYFYISNERNFHWWVDWYYPTIRVAAAFRDSPSEAIKLVQQTLVEERNRLYVLPLVPFILLFGSSRLVYEIGLALVYLLPLPLVMGAIATQLIPAHKPTVFWSTALLTLLIPVNWIPTFMGIPDTGGAVFIGLAAFVYLQDVRLKQWWRVPLIGLLIGLSILVRRHFVYGGVALLGAVALQGLMFFAAEVRKIPRQDSTSSGGATQTSASVNGVAPLTLARRGAFVSKRFRRNQELTGRSREANLPLQQNMFVTGRSAGISSDSIPLRVKRNKSLRESFALVALGLANTNAWRNLLLLGVQIGAMGATALATLYLVAPQFTHAALTVNYRTFYKSWSLPFNDIANLYANFYGWATWLMVLIGFFSVILTRSVPLPAINFMGFFGVLSLIAWLVVLRYANVFYALHITPLVVIGLVAFIWTIWIRLRGKVRAIALSAIGCYLVSNLVFGLAPIGKFDNFFRPLFALNIPPLVRTDYDEVGRLVKYLLDLAPNEEPIFVVGYQRLHLDSSGIKIAELILYERDPRILNVLPSPKVDSRDEYPIETLLQAQYVVVPNPLPRYPGDATKVPAIGEWLPDKEVDVVNVVFDAFTQNWEYAQDFKRLPVKFTLENGSVVNIYKRIRPTSLSKAVRTLHTIQQKIGERPGSQKDWIILSKPLKNYSVSHQQKNTYSLVAEYDRNNSASATPERTQKPASSFLYLGSLPEKAEVTGKMAYLDKPCVSSSLQLTMLNKEGQIVSSTEAKYSPRDSSKFRVSISGKNSAYLVLDILTYDKNDAVNSCTLEINSLAVSSKKS